MADRAYRTTPTFDLPPILQAEAGRPRAVGIELEFAGLTAQTAAHLLADAFGGSIAQENPHAFLVEGSAIGDFAVKLDLRYAHPAKKEAGLLGDVEALISDWVGSAASYVLPCELDSGPVPIDRLHEVDRAVEVLRRAGARGTQDAAIYAFALHFNPETPRYDIGTIASVLKAFVMLNGWLRRQVAPDLTRYLLGFADPFPQPYVRKLVTPDYRPDPAGFIDDYLAANPTRNRDLDLLPLLRFLDEERVLRALPHEKINKRPTFHYRLPDARVSDFGWSIAPDWNRWVAIERLAADQDRLDEICRAYLAFRGDDKSWTDRAERIAFG